MIAYLRLPGVRSTSQRWADAENADDQLRLVGSALLAGYASQPRLPDEVRGAGPEGLALLVVDDHVVVAAFRIRRLTAKTVDLHSDRTLAQRWVGTMANLKNARSISLQTTPGETPGPPLQVPVDRTTRRRPAEDLNPPPQQAGDTDRAVKSAMDAPPSI